MLSSAKAPKLPGETELGLRSVKVKMLQPSQSHDASRHTERSCTTKTALPVRKRWNKHMTAQAASWERWVFGGVEDLCIYSFWHVNAQCLVHFRSMKGADANLDLDVLPSLTARKAKKISPEFGCLPSEDEQWNGQKHSSPMVQRSDYPPHSPQMANGMAARWSNSRSVYPALNSQPLQRALMWIHIQIILP